MAGYREHISVSGLLGAAYGAGLTFAIGFSPVQGTLAGVLTWVAGMLPDLDSQSGKPVREMFSLLAAAVPMVLMQHLLTVGENPENAMLLTVALYAAIRYGGAWLLGKVSVHRGMFHSIPAMLIAAELTYLGYKSEFHSVRLAMGLGVAIGFLSHLVLDEIYAVEWTGIRLRLNKFAGSALKLMGKSVVANVVTYGLLCALTYALLVDVGILKESPLQNPQRILQHAVDGLPTRR
jgi:membrane-bound metal-dependent hydrolase YbcI (DUF457 family)